MSGSTSEAKYEPISGHDLVNGKHVEEFELQGGKPKLSDDEDCHSATDESHLLTPYQTSKGLTLFTASVFLAGELAGTGVLTMPSAMSRTGYSGIAMIFVTLILATFCGILLGKCWEIAKYVRNTDDPMQDPYPYIGEVAFGKYGRHMVSVLLQINIVLICLVFLTLTAEIVSSLFSFHIASIPVKEEFRVWLVICALVILPLTWLGTPKDFWGIGLAALSSTIIGAICIMIKLGIIVAKEGEGQKGKNLTIVSFFSGFGTFIFAFTGISLFPTVQTDMKDPKKFSLAVVLGYLYVVVIYLPVAVLGYVTLGNNVNSSVLKSLSEYDVKHKTARVLISIADVLFASHLLFAFIMYLNPWVQLFESYFKITEFSLRRCALRSGAVLFILGLAEIFPKFGPVIDLVGGFLNTILCFIFPILFYYKLHRPIPLSHLFVMVVALIISIIGCVFSTYAAIWNIQKVFREIYA